MKNESEQKEINKSLKFIFTSSLFVFMTVIFSKFLTYAYRIVIARYFGPEVYGLFSLAMMTLLFLVALSSLGLVEGTLRFMSYYRGKREYNKVKYVFRLSSTILLFSSLLIGIILFFLSDFIALSIFKEQELSFFLKVFSILVPAYLFLYLFSIVIQAHERIKVQSFILDILENFFKLTFLILFIFLGIKTNAVIFSYFLGVIISLIIAFLYCKYKISGIFDRYSLEPKLKNQTRKKLLTYSWPLILYSIIYGILPHIDSFFIGYFNGALDVGLYNAAVPIGMLIILFPNLFMRLFFPLITKEFSRKNYDVVKELSKQIEKWILIMVFPIFLMLVIFPGAFINIFFGPEYILASNSLRILSIGFLFYSTSIILHSLISAIGKTKLILFNITISAIFNIVLNIVLIPKFGINGAAIATTISYMILTIVFFYQTRKNLSFIPIRRKMIKIVFAAIPPTLILLYIKPSIPLNIITIIIQGTFFLLLYLLIIFISKSLDKNDLMILKMIHKKIASKI